MTLMIILVAVIVLVFAVTIWSIVMDWRDTRKTEADRQAVQVIVLEAYRRQQKRARPACSAETRILATIEWDTRYHPIEEPAYPGESSQ
jgi:hypothetical protein